MVALNPSDMQYKLRLPGIAADSATPSPSLVDRMLASVTYERVARGLKPYLVKHEAALAAQARTDDMAKRNYFGHRDPHGITMYVLELNRVGIYNFKWAGENLAMSKGFKDPVATAMDGLMKSPTHRENILEPSAFTHIGVGYTLASDGKSLFVQVFLGL